MVHRLVAGTAGCMPDLLLRLVDADAWHALCLRSPASLVTALEGSDLRSLRPQQDSRLEEEFEVDLEGDLLEWFDRFGELVLDHDGALIDAVTSARLAGNLDSTAAAMPLLHLAGWSSVGTWRAWEGRVLLYVEPLIGRSFSHSDELYEESVWNEVREALARTDESGFAEGVVLDWMQRREGLGSTLDESEDPRILPTMTAHERAARTLHHTMERVRRESLLPILGREWLEAHRWGVGVWNLGRMVDGGWPEVIA